MEQKSYNAELSSKPGIVKSVRLAVDVLKCLGDGSEMLTKIASRLKLSKSTVHRLLKTLEASGMVSQDSRDRRYRLGSVIISLATSYDLSHQRLTACALEDMKYLRDISGETVHIYARIGAQIICLEELPSEQAVKLTVGKGSQLPLHVGSEPLILLSDLDDNEIERIIKNVSFTPFTPNTLTDKSVFIAKVREARRQGWAMSRGTYALGAASIAVLIKNYSSPVALSILGPEARFEPNMMDILEELKDRANRISTRLLKEG